MAKKVSNFMKITVTQALEEMRQFVRPEKAKEMAKYHKVSREVMGVSNPEITALAKGWRSQLSVEERVNFSAQLWASGLFEARIAAAKLLTQARLRPDESAWALIASWVPEFDCWAIADHAAMAGQRRLIADPARLDEVEAWTAPEQPMWTRRAALVFTLPWTKQNHPKPDEIVARERVLGWAAGYAPDHDWFIQKAVAWWLRDLSRHDVPRVRAFLAEHGAAMKPWAVREASRHLPEDAS